MATTMEDNFKFSLDIHFAQRLAGNFAKIRERTVKKLKRWIAARSLKQGGDGMEDELLRLWKGLFYCMWMCDKPVIQEELADKIADLIHSFTTPKGAMAFFDAFLLTMKREWAGIDRLRMDKYFMFIRRCFRQVLVVLRNNNWEESVVDQFLAVLCKTPLSTDPEASPDGLRYHFIDIYREELARCAGKELTPSDQVMKLFEPFFVLVTSTRNKTLLKVILRGFFQEIVDESDVGFPVDSEDEGIDSGEDDREEAKETVDKDEDMEEEEEETVAKKKKYVQKERPKLQYDYQAIADHLFALASQESTPGPVRRKVYSMVKKFRDLKEGVFPDYNMGSLIDYQDDGDGKIYGDKRALHTKKTKKPLRRGGKLVRERRLAKAALKAAKGGEDIGEGDADGLDEEGRFRDLKEGVFPDYNMGSLIDYQDDGDGKIYGDKRALPTKKTKKPLRRGGKLVRERRLAKAALKAAKGGEDIGEGDADGLDEGGKILEKGEKRKKKRRPRRKKILTDSINEEAEAAKSTDATSKGEKTSMSENNDRQDAYTPAEHENDRNIEITGDKCSKEAAKESKEKFSPGFEETDGGVKEKKKAKKRNSEGNQIEVDSNGENIQKKSETTATKNPEMAAEKIETAAETKVESTAAASKLEIGRKCKGKAKQRETTETPESHEDVGDSVNVADAKETVQLETGCSQNQLQLNLSKTDEEPSLSWSANTSKQSKGSATATDTSNQLNNGSKPQTPSKGGKQKTRQPFAAFQAVSTPPAYVRRRPIRKEGEPQTEPPRKKKSRLSGVSDDTDSDQATPRKRVKIALGLNKAHASKDYKKQLESSPGVPFDGSKKPTQSVLKTPSPKPRPPTQKITTPTFKTPSLNNIPPPGTNTKTPIFKTPSPKVIMESKVKSSSKKVKTPKTATSLRRSSRIKQITF